VKKTWLGVVFAMLLWGTLMVCAQTTYGNPVSDKEAQVRALTGQVMDGREQPLAGAIVYLKNTKTMAVKTFIAGDDGMYRFNALSPNVDYEVYAEHNGKKSDTKTLSSFDSRKTAYINLKIKG
jgi:protocatechuate 3,4-dioxygenase beta subunit